MESNYVEIANLLTALAALIISWIALHVAIKAFELKSGAYIRGSFEVATGMHSGDNYISSVTLENLKDRSTVVFAIYLKIGNGCYLEIDDFENEPVVLKPFEVFRKSYPALIGYDDNLMRIKPFTIFTNKKRKLVLSTPDGKYVVKSWVKDWHPFTDFFRNHLTSIVYPVRYYHKGKSYGNAKYIVELRYDSGQIETFGIYDKEFYRFKNTTLTKTDLSSQETLYNFFGKLIAEGKLPNTEIEVFDPDVHWKVRRNFQDDELDYSHHPNLIKYHILGPIMTKFRELKLYMENRQTRKNMQN